VAGIILLIGGFQVSIFLMLALLLILAFPVSGFMRKQLACMHCKQRDMGCPADRLFRKNTENK
jgi:hypothetical protein